MIKLTGLNFGYKRNLTINDMLYSGLVQVLKICLSVWLLLFYDSNVKKNCCRIEPSENVCNQSMESNKIIPKMENM